MKFELTSLKIDRPYDAYVREAKEGKSQAGNQMITLTLSIFDESGKEHTRFENLMALYPPNIKSFCEATGLTDQLNAMEITEDDCRYKNLRVIYKRDPKGRDGIGVKEYLPQRDEAAARITPKDLEDFDDSDIIF